MKIVKIIISFFYCLSTVNCIRNNIHWTSLAEVNETNGYSTTRILDFWKKHEKDFEIGTQKDIILLLGNKRAGVTTMSLLLTDADLESINLDDDINYNSIIDKNGRIGHEKFPKTFVPELLIDPMSGAAFYDCPSLGYSPGLRMENEVATAYFLNKLINSANSIKLVIIFRYESNSPVKYAHDLLENFERIFNMMNGDIEKFNGGIAIIANRDRNKVMCTSETKYSLDDAILTNRVIQFLENDLKNIVDEENGRYSRHFLRQATKFIKMLLVKRNDKYERIGIFRKASKSSSIQGPVNDIEVFQNERVRLKEIIHKNIKYVPKGDTEYGYPLSFYMRNNIQKVIEKIIKKELLVDVINICDQIEHFYFLQEKEITDINLLETNLKTAYRKLSGIGANDARAFIMLIIDAANILEIHLPNETLEKIAKHIENIDFLTKVSASPSENSFEFIEKLSETITQIRNSHKWYEFLIYLKRELSRNDSHSDWTKEAAIKVQTRCLIDESEMRYASSIYFERFSIYANVRRYDYVKKLRLNSFELKALHSVLNVLWQSDNSTV